MYCTLLFHLFISITGGYASDEDVRVMTCEAVYEEAELQGLDPIIAVSVAWMESRWVPDAHNRKSGAIGPLQMLPKYWCPDRHGEWHVNGEHVKTCNTVRWGVNALRYYVQRRKTLRRALSEFGYTKPDSKYVRLTLRLIEAARRVAKKPSAP